MYPPRKLGLYTVGLIVLIFGIILFIIGFVDEQTLQSSQISMGSILILILGIILLWRGAMIKGTMNPNSFYTFYKQVLRRQ